MDKENNPQDEVLQPEKVNILDHPLLNTYRNLPTPIVDRMANVIHALTGNTSYALSINEAKELTSRQGKNRKVYNSIEDIELELNPTVQVNIDEELDSLFISELSEFIKKMEDIFIRRPGPRGGGNKFHALMIKLISSNFYFEYPDLYKPESYSDLIDEFLQLPESNRDYYKKVIKGLLRINPKSPGIPDLLKYKNAALHSSNQVENFKGLHSMDKDEYTYYLEERKNYKDAISPSLKAVRDRLNFPSTTYEDNITKVISELIEYINDPTLTKKFNSLAFNL